MSIGQLVMDAVSDYPMQRAMLQGKVPHTAKQYSSALGTLYPRWVSKR